MSDWVNLIGSQLTGDQWSNGKSIKWQIPRQIKVSADFMKNQNNWNLLEVHDEIVEFVHLQSTEEDYYLPYDSYNDSFQMTDYLGETGLPCGFG